MAGMPIRLARALRNSLKGRKRLLYRGTFLALAVLISLQFLSLQVREAQLNRREQALERSYEQVHGIIQATEQIARRIEEDLDRQQELMDSLQANLPELRAALTRQTPPLELPLDPAPSQVPSPGRDGE